MCLFISFPVSVPLHSFPLFPPSSVSPPAPTLSPFISVSLSSISFSPSSAFLFAQKDTHSPHLSLPLPLPISLTPLSPVLGTLYLITPLLSHPPLSFFLLQYIFASFCPFPGHHRLSRSLTLKLEPQLFPSPMHWSPLWLAGSGPSPKVREEGPSERGEVSELRGIHREFLNPSMTPDASPAQSDSCITEEDRLGPQSHSFLAPHPHGSPP